MIFIKFIIDGEPHGKGRPRFTRAGHTFTDKKTRDYEKQIKNEYKKQIGRKLEGNLKVEVKAFYKIAKSDTKKVKDLKRENKIRPTKKPDIDNILKSILDGLNKIAYDDDAQVIEVIGSKYYSDRPRVEVIISNI